MVMALAVAIGKPWESTAPDAAVVLGRPSAAATTSAAPSASPTLATAPPAAPSPEASSPTWADLAPVVNAHATWGVRAIVLGRSNASRMPATPHYVEHWAPTSTDPDGVASAVIAHDDGFLVALGVTVPLAEVPRGARIWRVHRDAQLEWIDARRIDTGGTVGSMMFLLPGIDGSPVAAWAAGQYRIDVLVNDVIRRIAVQVLDRSGSVPQPSDWPPPPAGLVPAASSDPSAVHVGMFATVDGIGVPLAAVEHEPLAEDVAWLDLARTDGLVASAYLPRATGLGVMLSPHAFVQTAIIRRLTPDLPFEAPPATGGISDSQGRTPYVLFAAEAGGTWAPGVYAISVTWNDGAGLHRGTWHVALLPGGEQRL